MPVRLLLTLSERVWFLLPHNNTQSGWEEEGCGLESVSPLPGLNVARGSWMSPHTALCCFGGGVLCVCRHLSVSGKHKSTEIIAVDSRPFPLQSPAFHPL